MREAEGCSVMRTCIVLPSPQVSCILCPLGRGGTGGLCPACGLGTYADEEGLTECKQADPGTFCPGIGMKRTGMECPAGTKCAGGDARPVTESARACSYYSS